MKWRSTAGRRGGSTSACTSLSRSSGRTDSRKQKELELERQYLPVRYRKRPEYIPLPSEINKMVIAGRNPAEKAIVLFVYEGGLRNSTARGVRYADVKGELEAGLEVVHVPVRSLVAG